jgi:hypothetical protein
MARSRSTSAASTGPAPFRDELRLGGAGSVGSRRAVAPGCLAGAAAPGRRQFAKHAQHLTEDRHRHVVRVARIEQHGEGLIAVDLVEHRGLGPQTFAGMAPPAGHLADSKSVMVIERAGGIVRGGMRHEALALKRRR